MRAKEEHAHLLLAEELLISQALKFIGVSLIPRLGGMQADLVGDAIAHGRLVSRCLCEAQTSQTLKTTTNL
jgi:hypothetical protein